MLGGDDALLIEQTIGAGDGIEVDPQIGGQLADGGELVAWLEFSGGDLVLDLVDELHVDGDVRLKVYFDIHFQSNFVRQFYDIINCELN